MRKLPLHAGRPASLPITFHLVCTLCGGIVQPQLLLACLRAGV